MQMELEKTSETSANASIGYLDGDGDLDVVLAKGRHWPLHNRILINDGHGGFSRDRRFVIPSESTTTIVAADFNSDRFWTSQILDMSLRFGRPHSLRRWKRAVYGIALGDLNLDGKLDVPSGEATLRTRFIGTRVFLKTRFRASSMKI